MKLISTNNFFSQKKDNLSFIVLLNFIFAAVYFLISYSCLKFATISSNVSPIWPSTGLAISLLILFGRQYTFSIFVGALLANTLTAGPFLNAIVIAFGNTLEAYFGFILYTRLIQHKNKFEHLSDLLTIAPVSLLAPVFSATIGVCSLRFFGLLPEDVIFAVWLTWWIADAIGAMILIPIFISIKNKELLKLYLELKTSGKKHLIYAFTSIFTTLIFYIVLKNTYSLKYLFLLFPLFIFITFIRNRLFTYCLSALLCSTAIFATVNGRGPFNLSSLNQNLVNLEIFIFAICITTLALVHISHFRLIKQIRILLVAGWIFWGFIFYFVQTNHDSLDDIAFKNTTSDLENRIKEKMRDYLQVLTSGRALYMASTNVDPEEWKSFVTSLNISKSYEGMNGMGVVFKVENSQIEDYLKNAKKTIDPNFIIKKVPLDLDNRPVHRLNSFFITYIEPYEKNKAARGLDLGSELNRRVAAEKAILSGYPIISDRVRLIQDQKKRLGFLAYLPVYKQGFPISTPEERISSFSHWIYAPFITEKFLDSIFKKINDQNIAFQIYDKPELTEENLIYSYNADIVNSGASGLLNSIQLGDKIFYIKWSKSKYYTVSHDFLSTWIGLIGAIMVLTVILFIINAQSLEEKSKKIANELHFNFLESQKIVKEHEMKMIESRRMATLGQMASSIAHEINNPLAIISGNNQHIKWSLEEISDFPQKEKIINYSIKIERMVKRIDNIIKGLRLISRDATKDEMANISFSALLEETLSLCKERFRTSNIALTVNSTFNGDLFCRGTQISQVIINLLNNAHDAIEELEEKWVLLDVNQIGENLKISVTDSGKGIPLEVQEKIMQPFFTTKEIGKGTGLGLSISKGIIESHSGSLIIETRDGHTCFVITLPVHPTA